MCIALTMVALHDLEVKAADMLKTYVKAPNHEKRQYKGLSLGTMGDNTCKSAIIVRALYGLKSAEASFRKHPAQCRLEQYMQE